MIKRNIIEFLIFEIVKFVTPMHYNKNNVRVKAESKFSSRVCRKK